MLWSEDFANGLSGNNSSTVQTWTVAGTHSNLWEHDNNGSDGPYAGNSPLTLESETKDNGWMIFDADKANTGLPQSAFVKKHGELISPSIDLSNDTNVSLTFTHMYRYCCGENYKLKVYVSSDGSSWGSGVDVSIVSASNHVERDTVELNITPYAGQKSDVKIKFSWEANGAEAYFWMIDDVKILKTKPYDADLLYARYLTPTTFGGASFRIMNLEQAKQTAYTFFASLRNTGYKNIDNTRIYAKVVGGSQSFQSHTKVSTPGSIDTLYTNQGFTPSQIGIYYADIFGSNDENQFRTDSIRLRFEIDQYEYGKDNGNYNQGRFGRYFINETGRYEIGNRFMIYKDQKLKAVKIRMDTGTGSQAQGKIHLYKYNTTSKEFVFEKESQIENIGQNNGKWFNFVLNQTWQLSANTQYLVMLYVPAQTSEKDDKAYISTSGRVYPNESYTQDVDGTSGSGVTEKTWFYTVTAPCLRLNFDPAVGIHDSFSNSKKFSVYPNPNNGIFKVSFDEDLSENSSIEIHNILGQLVHEEFLSSHTLTKEVNLKHLEKGIYTISLNMQAETAQTQKIINK